MTQGSNKRIARRRFTASAPTRIPHGLLIVLATAFSPPARSTVCEGPDLHSLRMVNATTLEVQGRGGTAQTSDGGKTWRLVAGPPRLVADIQATDSFNHRAFRGPAGYELQNLGTGAGNVVIQRTPRSPTWHVAWTGVLLQVSGDDAFVYLGETHGPAIQNRGWELRTGVVEQMSLGTGSPMDDDRSARLKVEFKPGSVCVHTEATWDQTSCKSAWTWQGDSPFPLTGFAVAPRRAGVEYPNPRDVYLASRSGILHWRGASQSWAEMPSPPDWFWCNGPIPRN